MRMVSVFISALRLAIGARLVADGGLAAAFGGGECVAGCLGLLNVLRAKEWESGWRAWAVVYSYGIIAVWVPMPSSSSAGSTLAIASMISLILLGLQIWARLTLFECLSLGPPNFVRVCDGGLLRVVRHPCVGLGIMLRAVVVAVNPVGWNLCGLAVHVALGVLVVMLEEDFLRSRPGYVEYAQRVRWRWLPGIW